MMTTPTRGELKDQRLGFRVAPREKRLIEEAAEISHKDVSAFVLDTMLTESERILTDRRVFPLSDDRWDAFMEILDRPVAETLSDKPRLARLLETPSVLER